MEGSLESDIKPIVESMGMRLVEVSIGRARRQTHVRVVVHKPSGVGVDDCGRLARMLQPRLETVDNLPDLTLEVSSPGVDRKLKSNDELAVFVGKGVRVLTGDDWITGIISGVEDGKLILEQEQGLKSIEIVDIRRARLDYALEAVR